jgi:hypothetical protein
MDLIGECLIEIVTYAQGSLLGHVLPSLVFFVCLSHPLVRFPLKTLPLPFYPFMLPR